MEKKPSFLSETEFCLAKTNNGVLRFSKYNKNRHKRFVRLLDEGVIHSIVVANAKEGIVINLW